MYRNNEEQPCYMQSYRRQAMAQTNWSAQAIAITLPQTRRAALITPLALSLSLIISLNLIILVNLVLILLGL